MTRRAISPRLATSTVSNTGDGLLDGSAGGGRAGGRLASGARETSRVLLVAVVLVAALLLGWAMGGSLHRLSLLRLRYRWLVVAAAAVQLGSVLPVAAGAPDGVVSTAYAGGLAVSAVLVAVFVVVNRRIAGMGLVA